MGAEPLTHFSDMMYPDTTSLRFASPAAADHASTTVKMEDLQSQYHASPSPETSSPMPDGSAKPAKKRKSWGQVLPEPKTNLPPRKRAKTEDEKEQRRIERVLRNRLAAHNSRERKRQEVEQLQGEKEEIQQRLNAMAEQLAHMQRQLELYRSRYPDPDIDAQALQFQISPSIGNFHADTVCPSKTSMPSPESMDSFDSPRDTSSQPATPATPAYSEITNPEFGPTRYPAEILCDLQCQPNSRLSTMSRTLPVFQLLMAFLSLLNLRLSRTSSQSSNFSTSRNTLRQSTPPNPTSNRHSWRRTPRHTLTDLVTLSTPKTSICRQTQAQQILLATCLTSQLKVFSDRWAAMSPEYVNGSALDCHRGVRPVRVPTVRASRRNSLRVKRGTKRSCVGLRRGSRSRYGLIMAFKEFR